jgi:hypothetical protein
VIGYIPATGYIGADSFIVEVSDGNLTASITVNVTVRPVLTVSANPQTITYGDADPAFTFNTSGFASGDDSSNVDTLPTCNVAGAHVNVGSYPITCSDGVDDQYDFVYVNNDLTITKTSQTIINTIAPSSAVNGQLFTVSADATSGLLVSYSALGSCTNTGANFAMISGVGVCTVQYNQEGNTNYNAASQVTQIVADANDVPMDIALSSTNVNESVPSGTIVGSLTTTDPDTSNIHTYSLVNSGASCLGTNNDSFSVSGNDLLTTAVFNASVKNTYIICVRAMDNGVPNLSIDKQFAVTVNDVTPPQVNSILRSDPNPTAKVSVNFTVIFSENVTGVDTSDFSLATTGVTGASITSVSGNNTSYTVTANTGTGSGTIRLKLIDDDTIADSASNKLGGIGVGNGNFNGQPYSVKKSLTYTSGAAQDGWVLESGENTNVGGTGASNGNATATTFNLGDNAQDRQYRSILHFDTLSLPDNAVITSATLRIKKSGLVGSNPFNTHQGLMVDITKPYFGTSMGLQPNDFNAAANQSDVGTFGSIPSSSWYTAILGSNAYSYINLTGATQFRLRFQLDDNDDLGADYMLFFSGNSTATNRPVLVIEYFVP